MFTHNLLLLQHLQGFRFWQVPDVNFQLLSFFFLLSMTAHYKQLHIPGTMGGREKEGKKKSNELLDAFLPM